jgi:phosphoribosylaminoimidazolecarboxamide formyltransferase/IMP cyclohydrolase
MKIGVIGTGKLGTSLIKLLSQDNKLSWLVARSDTSYEKVSQIAVKSTIFRSIVAIDLNCDCVFICTDDKSLALAIQQLAANNHINHANTFYIHCAGSLGIDIFQPLIDKGAKVAACHPYQTFFAENTASFNNILDINAAAKLIIEFDEPTVAIIKHTNPCGVGTAATLAEAYQKAFATDTVSPFGGIIAVNRRIDLDSALAMHDIFTEVIIAPDFSYDALELLTRKKDRRLIKADYDLIADFTGTDVRSVVGGFLLQDENKELFDENKMQIVTQRKPSESEYKALMFAWKICKHVKSNAIVYCADDRTMGIGAGQMSRVDSSRIAVEKAKLMGLDLDGTVVASDAFFPFADGLLEAAKAGATAIIQPGGSVRDEEVIKAADANNLAMIFTGMRHFKH